MPHSVATEAIDRRSAIADESMLGEAAAKLSALHTAPREALKNVSARAGHGGQLRRVTPGE